MLDNRYKRDFVQKITSIPEFAKGEYKLYEDVPVRYIKKNKQIYELQAVNIDKLNSDQNEIILDFLICKGETVVLCISFNQNEDTERIKLYKTFLKGMAVFKVSCQDITVNECRKLLLYCTKIIEDESKIRFALPTLTIEKLFCKINLKPGKTKYKDINEFQNIMEEEHLIQKYIKISSENIYGYLPTEYGRECGLIKSCAIDIVGNVCYEILTIENIDMELNEIFKWREGWQKQEEEYYICNYTCRK